MNDKKYFKITTNIQMAANMSFAMFLVLIAGIVFWIIYPTDPALIFLIAGATLYVISFILGIKVTNEIKDLKFSSSAQRYIDSVVKQSRWFLLSIVFVFTVQQLRATIWKVYSHEKTKHLKKASDIAKANIELLEELKAEGYISKLKYDSEKGRLEANLETVINIEKAQKLEKKNKVEKKDTIKGDSRWD